MSYANNPLSILAGAGIVVAPTTGTGINQLVISVSGTQVTAVRVAVVTPVVVTNADEVVAVAVPGGVPVAVTLPVGTVGRTFNIKDALGLATAIAPITITPAAGTIDGAATATINVPYGSLTLVYSGTQWLIL